MREQLPLKLAWALTIHKSQGLTLPKAWVNIEKSEQTLGITYVAGLEIAPVSGAFANKDFDSLLRLKFLHW